MFHDLDLNETLVFSAPFNFHSRIMMDEMSKVVQHFLIDYFLLWGTIILWWNQIFCLVWRSSKFNSNCSNLLDAIEIYYIVNCYCNFSLYSLEETHEDQIVSGIFTQSAHRTRIIAAYLLFEVYYNMPINEIMQATISERPLLHISHSGLAELFQKNHTLDRN